MSKKGSKQGCEFNNAVPFSECLSPEEKAIKRLEAEVTDLQQIRGNLINALKRCANSQSKAECQLIADEAIKAAI